jgi:cytochrome c2
MVNPRRGTKMSFAGMPERESRQKVIDYLRVNFSTD